MRYIDIIKILIRNASEKDIPALDWDEQRKHLSMIKARIDDVEIVVRCKDCKHYSVMGRTTQFGFCGYRHAGTDETNYCSRGVRREP